MKRKSSLILMLVLAVVLCASLAACNKTDIRNITGLEIVKAPEKVSYVQGEELNLTGLEVKVIYKKTSEKVPLDKLKITGYDKDKLGEQTVTVGYTATQKKKSVTKTAAFKVTVTAASHEHNFSAEWSKDASNHWHDCTDDGCDVIKDSAPHAFGGWVTVTEATEDADGLKKKTCSVCGYEATEVIPAVGHTHSYAAEWTGDADYHWHAATCGHEVVADKAAHIWNDGVVTTEPTATTVGEKTFTCTVCGRTKTEAIPALGAATGTAAFADTYNPAKTYDRTAVTAPTAADYVTNSNGAVTVEWYQGSDKLDAAPFKAGDYSVKISIAATADFTAATASKDFTIGQKTLTVHPTGLTKTYTGQNGINSRVPVAEGGAIEGDAILYRIIMVSANVGTVIDRIELFGDAKVNYKLGFTKDDISASITPKPLSNVIITKEYDGSVGFRIEATADNGLIDGDAVEIDVNAADANVGTDKEIEVDGISLSGTSAGNYSLPISNVTLNITKATPVVTASSKKDIYVIAAPTANDITIDNSQCAYISLSDFTVVLQKRVLQNMGNGVFIPVWVTVANVTEGGIYSAKITCDGTANYDAVEVTTENFNFKVAANFTEAGTAQDFSIGSTYYFKADLSPMSYDTFQVILTNVTGSYVIYDEAGAEVLTNEQGQIVIGSDVTYYFVFTAANSANGTFAVEEVV